MEIRNATIDDFDIVFGYIEQLWTANTYDKEEIRTVYTEVLADENTFAFLLFDEGKARGFCHGAYFNTFWHSGKTCYLSSIISNIEDRGKGYGRKLMDHAKELAESQGCKAIVLDTGLQRKDAHRFYDIYGFEKCAYCYQLKLG
ncbi:N-acetyltransferase family protein [Sporosarcina sp. CAU 1771]